MGTPAGAGKEQVGKDDRYYDLNGKKYVSVTTVLKIINKPALNAWMVKQGAEGAKKISEETADLGTQFHGFVEQLIKHELGIGEFSWENVGFQKNVAQSPKEVKAMLESWREWWADYKKETGNAPVASEQVVFSDLYGYAGTMDCEVTKEVLDWKTSAGIYPEMKLQALAYSFARAEMHARRFLKIAFGERGFDDQLIYQAVRQSVAVECTPKPIRICTVVKKEPHDCITMPKKNGETYAFSWDEFGVFLAALKLWNWQNAGKEKRGR